VSGRDAGVRVARAKLVNLGLFLLSFFVMLAVLYLLITVTSSLGRQVPNYSATPISRTP